VSEWAFVIAVFAVLLIALAIYETVRRDLVARLSDERCKVKALEEAHAQAREERDALKSTNDQQASRMRDLAMDAARAIAGKRKKPR
jgi:hypothetical protein